MLEERRKQRRIIFPFKVIVATEEQGNVDIYHTENISTGGVRVISQKELSKNDQVKITIDTGEKTLISNGKVVWLMHVAGPKGIEVPLYDIGIEFIALPPSDKQFLEELLADLHQQ